MDETTTRILWFTYQVQFFPQLFYNVNVHHKVAIYLISPLRDFE